MLFYLLLIAVLPFYVIAYQQDSDDSSVEMAEQGMAFEMASEKINRKRRFSTIPWMFEWEMLFSRCMKNCKKTTDNKPVCGSDGVIYMNRSELRCVQECGKDIRIRYFGFCTKRTYLK